jgi:phage shock protein E
MSLWMIGHAAFGQSFLDPRIAHKLEGEGKATIIDVREAEETESGMVKGALWFPISKAQKNGPELEQFLSKLSKDKIMVVYCRSGKRAAIFVSILKNRGFKAENMGAFSDWQKANLPISKQNGALNSGS